VKFRRFDVGTLGAVTETPTGGLRVPAHVTRTGVLQYRDASGIRREYRPPEEVFAPDSLASLNGAVVTVGHPDDFVTRENFSAHSAGWVVEGSAKPDGTLLDTMLTIARADACLGVESKTLVEISCGYSCDTDETPGTSPEGERYDAIQKNIRYNHVALLEAGQGRAGSRVRLRTDSAYQSEAQVMMIVIDGKEFDPSTPEGMAAMQEALDMLLAERDTLKAEVAEKVDSAAEPPAEDAAPAEKTDSEEDPKAFQARVDSAVQLRATAMQAYPSLVLRGKDDRQIMIDVIKRVDSMFAPLASHSDVYLRGRFDGAISKASTAVTVIKKPNDNRTDADDDDNRTDADDDVDPYTKNQQRNSPEAFKARQAAASKGLVQ
jgi:uncharacterized protein